MSLILEALKKLEREKQTPERGVVVLGPAALGGTSSGGRRALLALALAALLGVAGALTIRRDSAGPAGAAAKPHAVRSNPTPSPASPRGASRGSTTDRASVLSTRRAEPDAESLGASPPLPEPAARTPTAATPAPPPPALQLQAISRRDGRPVAVLSDRLLYEGDSFDGVRVIRIGETAVELEIGGRRVVVGF